jgi:osmoprotectant transport system permease protein
MLPILRNTVTGIANVDAAVVEAARGVGMTENQMLWRVQLPLAAPVIIAGIRTATIWTVGTATLATPIGATSLGNYIFAGLQTRNNAAILVGCVCAALLSITLDAIIRGLERGAQKRSRPLVLSMVAILGFIALASVAGPIAQSMRPTQRAVVRIGSKAFTEAYILAELTALQVKRETDYRPVLTPSLGSAVAFEALADGKIDTYVDYTGTIWTNVLKRETGSIGPQEMVREMAHVLPQQFGIEVVGTLGFENAYCLAMPRARADELGLKSIRDLKAVQHTLVLGTDMEFQARAEYRTMRDDHDLPFKRVRAMDSVLMYPAVVSGEVDVISAYTTDGRIKAFDLAVLEDDLEMFPPYHAVILAGSESLESLPGLRPALRGLVDRIDQPTMLQANWNVDQQHRSAADVAAELLAAFDENP